VSVTRATDPVVGGVVAFVPSTRVLVVGGADRLRFLHAVTAADVAALVPGEGAYGALTDERGRPVSDFHLYVLPEAVLLELPTGRAEEARATLDRLVIADDVTTAWASGETVAYESADPARLATTLAAARAGRFTAPAGMLAAMAPAVGYDEAQGAAGTALEDVPARRQAILRASRLGGHGALHWSAAGRAGELAAAVTAAGSGGSGAVTVALSATQRDPLEIEAGRLGAAELAEAKVWNELGAMHAVSLTKGCWMGQEIVRRVHARGEVQRRLAGVVLEVPHGTGWDGARLETPGGAPAGTITRAARSPSLGTTVALAFVHRAAWTPGSPLVAVRGNGVRAPATTAGLPFVRRVPDGAGTPAFQPVEIP
jgi:folate-binding protein YgfZ